ncbi:hypothetical protein [Actinomadura fulvescens]
MRSPTGGVMARALDAEGRPHGTSEIRDGRIAIGCRAACVCGWQGPLREKTDGDEAADRWGQLPDDVDDALFWQWQEHVRSVALASVGDLAAKAAGIAKRLTAAVLEARLAGSSWSDLGAAASISRQSAHERWSEQDKAPRVAGAGRGRRRSAKS